MGLLDKAKELENVKRDNELPRYFLFKLVFTSFLKDVGAGGGAFLVKQGKYFLLAFPIDIDCGIFKGCYLDATLVMSIEEVKGTPFVLFNSEMGDSIGTSLLSTSLLYKLDDLGCAFLLLNFEDRLDVLKNTEDILISKVKEFEKEYKKNEILVSTSVPPFPKYVGFSSIESKMQGAILASTRPNFIEFSFSSMFDFSSLHDDKDKLPVFYSIVNRISKMIGKSNFAILEKDLTLNACIFSSFPLDDVVYTSTLKTILSSIYGYDLVDKLEISFVRSLHDKNERISSWITESYNPLDSYEC